MSLAKKPGMTTKSLSKTELGYWKLVQKIEAGMKTPTVSRKAVMKALAK